MKKSVFMLGAVAAFALVSCKKTETTATDLGADSTATVVVADNDSLPITNDSTANAINDAAENAKNSTVEGVKDGVDKVKEGTNEATDGDGDITK